MPSQNNKMTTLPLKVVLAIIKMMPCGKTALQVAIWAKSWFARHFGRKHTLGHRDSFLSVKQNALPYGPLDILLINRLGGINFLQLPESVAIPDLAVPASIAATANYLIHHGSNASGLFRIPGQTRTVNAIYKHFSLQLESGKNASSSIELTIANASLPSHISFTLPDIASVFKKLLADIDGGILGSLALFYELKNITTTSHITPDTCHTSTSYETSFYIAEILLKAESCDQLSLIAAVFGLLSYLKKDKVDGSEDAGQSKEYMSSKALGVVFGPLLLGNKTDEVVVEDVSSNSKNAGHLSSTSNTTKTKALQSANLFSCMARAELTGSVTEALIILWEQVVYHLRSHSSSPFIRPELYPFPTGIPKKKKSSYSVITDPVLSKNWPLLTNKKSSISRSASATLLDSTNQKNKRKNHIDRSSSMQYFTTRKENDELARESLKEMKKYKTSAGDVSVVTKRKDVEVKEVKKENLPSKGQSDENENCHHKFTKIFEKKDLQKDEKKGEEAVSVEVKNVDVEVLLSARKAEEKKIEVAKDEIVDDGKPITTIKKGTSQSFSSRIPRRSLDGVRSRGSTISSSTSSSSSSKNSSLESVAEKTEPFPLFAEEEEAAETVRGRSAASLTRPATPWQGHRAEPISSHQTEQSAGRRYISGAGSMAKAEGSRPRAVSQLRKVLSCADRAAAKKFGYPPVTASPQTAKGKTDVSAGVTPVKGDGNALAVASPSRVNRRQSHADRFLHHNTGASVENGAGTSTATTTTITTSDPTKQITELPASLPQNHVAKLIKTEIPVASSRHHRSGSHTSSSASLASTETKVGEVADGIHELDVTEKGPPADEKVQMSTLYAEMHRLKKELSKSKSQNMRLERELDEVRKAKGSAFFIQKLKDTEQQVKDWRDRAERAELSVMRTDHEQASVIESYVDKRLDARKRNQKK